MKISAPLSSSDEVEMLVRSGAQELYAGILPSAWSRRFGARAPLSRRHSANANLGTLEELERAVSKAHALGARFFLALNAPQYSPEQCAAIVCLAKECARAGIDAFIVADLALLLSLRRAELGVALHLSSLGRAQNRAAIGFFAGLGVSRVILSRQVTLAEIAATASAHEGLEIEAFVLNDGCVFEESLCATTHARGAFCFTPLALPGARVAERAAPRAGVGAGAGNLACVPTHGRGVGSSPPRLRSLAALPRQRRMLLRSSR
ncbi:MAG: U32 family peptidase, partial [Deltaproteobacteria bacterium]|nr:U32 family peptidase [Deltaproteobacteria bacterium]